MERTVSDLKEGWRFALGTDQPPQDAFYPIHIPHDWAADRPISRDAPLNMAQGWFHRKDIGWYENSVHVPEKSGARRFFLDFGGVFECAAVWVNGQFAGEQRYGYTPFRLEVTDLVKTGENRIAVRVDNTREPADRWYSGCGIYRPVQWIETDRAYLDERNIFVQTGIQNGQGILRIRTGSSLPVTAALFDPNGAFVDEKSGREEIVLRAARPLLWSAETPFLYTLSLRLENGDAVSLRVGIRTVEISAEKGLIVNGESIKLRGVCLHQDMGCRGIAAAKEMWRDRLERLKEMGCNALRLAHHMHSSAMLDLCDEMGFYVYEEAFDKWRSGLYGRYFDRDWQHDLDAMLLRDRNRPSVIIWGVGNEVENQGQQSMVDILAMLTDFVRAKEPTRPVSYAMNPHFKRSGKKIDFSAVKDIQKLVDEVDDREIDEMEERLDCIEAIARHVDMISCNYQEQWFEDIHRRIPGKPILSTEAYSFFMGHPESMQNYTESIPAFLPEKYPFVIGSFVWTGYDYLGESMGWPSKGWTGSLLRMDGTPRIGYHILKSRWAKESMVHLSILDNDLGDELTKAHWANPPFEDVWDFPKLHQGVLPYLIAAHCERVEIHADGRVFHPALPGETPDGYILGFVPWSPGKIEVKGYIGNECVCSHALYTPDTPDHLAFSAPAQRTVLPGEEMMLTASIADAQGHPCIRDERTVSFRAEGDAEILATENCNLMEPTPYSSPSLPAWHGKASVVFRRTGKESFRIIAESDGLKAAVWDADSLSGRR
ncbi:MAG: glycoside hydrolase family 2 TIM barrel-domain containing protein [Clostridia bacterium]|nr:glycoside hydrolase family 2 TIM barrel-domain containing protein [Clostridia bacterium]